MQQIAPFISVIVPVKNALPHLDDCVKSIISQSLEEWEMICLNEESTDGSSEKLDNLASLEPRIAVVNCTCDNDGSARNLGLSKARGEYVLFLNADDYCEEATLETALAKARKHRADITIFGGRKYDGQTKSLSRQLQFVSPEIIEKKCFNRDDFPRNLFSAIYPKACAKLFRRSFLEENKLKFQQSSCAEELSFTLSAVALANRVVAFDGDFLRCRANSSLDSSLTKNTNSLSFLDALLDLKEQLESAKMFDFLRDAFNEQVLISARYYLDTATTDNTRQAILEALTLPEYTALDLLSHDEDWYSSAFAFECAKYLEAALRQRRALIIESEGFASQASFTCIIPRRTHGSPLISAIVPVFNTGHLVCETLDSIRNQGIDNIEIICVDDGSSDNTLEVLTAYAESDPRCSVYHQSNRGPGAARNVGQLVAQGTFLSFVDSDDVLAEHAYLTCLKCIEQNGLDMVIFDAKSFYTNAELEKEHPNFASYYARNLEYASPQSGAHMLHAMVKGDDYKPATWLYLVQRQLLLSNHIYTHPGIIHEDNGFTFRVLCHAKRVAHIRQALYYRRIRKKSIMTTPQSFANVYGYYASSLEMLDAIYSNTLIESEEVADSALQLVFRVQHNARRCYSEIPEYEMGALKALPAGASKTLTTAMDASNVSRRAKSIMEDKDREAKAELQRIKNSRAYRLGKLLLTPVRLFRQALMHGKK